MNTRRSFLTSGIAGVLFPTVSSSAQGKPFRIVVPFAAGGVQDAVARSLSSELGAELGQSVIIENRAGAGGTIGTAHVAKADADGSVTVLAAASHNIAGSLYSKLPYDPQKDFVPYAYIGQSTSLLIVHRDVPVKDAAELIRYARANPEKLNYASAGAGSATHLAMASFCALADVRMVHVPYKSAGEALNEVISGRVHAVIVPSVTALGVGSDSRLRLLGVTSAMRSRHLPNVPPVPDSGLPGYEFSSWYGLLGPAATPEAAAARIESAVASILASPSVRQRLDAQGIEIRGINREAFGRLLKVNYARMAEVVKAAGVRLDS